MSPFGFKKKIDCKFCDKSAEYLKEYNEYYCPKCDRFQSEELVDEVKQLQIFRLKNYTFNAQKYAYVIYNELGSKIAFTERRDLTKISNDKNYNVKYLIFNDVNRVIASVDGNLQNDSRNQNGSWKIYDYGRNLRGEIRYIADSDTWQIINNSDVIIALRDPKDNRSLSETMRQYTFVDSNNQEQILFQVKRKGGFKLSVVDNYFDSHLAWGFVIALHRKFYV